MKIATCAQMRESDRIAIESLGIPGVVLMEQAGMSVVEEICAIVSPACRIAVVCGLGNNGGDGMVIARHLIQRQYPVSVFLRGQSAGMQGDARVNLQIIQNLQIPILEICDAEDLKAFVLTLDQSSLIVDCLFGTGLHSEIEGLDAQIVESMNGSHVSVISADIPSGISGDTGAVMGVAVRAAKTVTFGAPKFGNILYPGAAYVGELVIRDIGIPESVFEEAGMRHTIIRHEWVRSKMPVRVSDSHKGLFGKVHLIAGSESMAGAGLLSGKSALRTGAGVVTLHIPESVNGSLKAAVPEMITMPYPVKKEEHLPVQALLRSVRDASAVVVGPGCGVSESLRALICSMIEIEGAPMVLDADALNVLALDTSVLGKQRTSVVLTPHIGEMSRLTGLSASEILKDLVRTALQYSRLWGVTLVLKSARTIVASQEGCLFINTNGNSGMSTAGSGDVLTGIIAGLIAQGMTPFEAAVSGVHIHGSCGDRAAEKFGQRSMVAGDIIEALPGVLKELDNQ